MPPCKLHYVRAGAVSERMLEGFGGVLRADGYSGYNQVRQALSVPILDDLKPWLEKNISRVPKDSLTHGRGHHIHAEPEGVSDWLL